MNETGQPSPLPRVSVIIPTYNRAEMFAQAVESALAQDYPALEVIASDNASTDGTAAAAARYASDPRFSWRRNPENLGMVGNWKKAVLDYASGDWFLILSDDDYLTDPGYISRAMALAGTDPGVALVYAGGTLLDADTGAEERLVLPFEGVTEGREVFLSRGLVKPMDFTLCNVLFNRRLALQQNPFHDPDDLLCDSELFLKMCLAGKAGVIKGPVSVYRRHSANLSGGRSGNARQLLAGLNFPVESYRAAKASGLFSADELDGYRGRVVMDWLDTALLCLISGHGKSYREAAAAVRSKLGPDLPEASAALMGPLRAAYIRFRRAVSRLLRGRAQA